MTVNRRRRRLRGLALDSGSNWMKVSAVKCRLAHGAFGMIGRRVRVLGMLSLVALATGCGFTTTIRGPQLFNATPESIAWIDSVQRSRPEPTLKVHHRSGALYVLTEWTLRSDNVLLGLGTRFDATRDSATVTRGNVEIPVDSIALLEADVPRKALTPMTGMIVTGISVVASVMSVAGFLFFSNGGL